MHPGRHEDNVLSLELERAAPREGLLRKQMRIYLGLTFILKGEKVAGATRRNDFAAIGTKAKFR